MLGNQTYQKQHVATAQNLQMMENEQNKKQKSTATNPSVLS